MIQRLTDYNPASRYQPAFEESWPKVPWLTVAMTFNPTLRASVIQADGKIMAGLFVWRPDDAAQDNAMLEINSGLQNCTSLRFSPSTDHLIAMSQTGMWIGQPLLSDNGILLASPLPKEASVLIVEQSGAIRKLPVQAATTNPDVKAPSANSGELLQQTTVLTAAAFRHSTGRLLVGTKDGRLVSVLVP